MDYANTCPKGDSPNKANFVGDGAGKAGVLAHRSREPADAVVVMGRRMDGQMPDSWKDSS